MPKALDLTGNRYGRLLVLTPASKTKEGKTRWLCICDCGTQAVVRSETMRNGTARSCGCYRSERTSARCRLPVVNYFGAHARVMRAKGRAAVQTCVDCGGAAAHWSYDGLDTNALYEERVNCWYSLSPDFYVPRCVSCHSKHDHPERAA